MTQPPRKRSPSSSSTGTRAARDADSRPTRGSGSRATRDADNRATRSNSSGARRTDGRLSPARIARAAAEQLTEISGAEPDSVSGLERTDDGWLVRVEVVEVRRIPDSTSVMASYEVLVDENGELRSYRRGHRYYRNQAGEV